jgi:molybdate transport system ATP-binding protein
MDSALLQVENLRVHISGKEILRDISLEIKPGEQWAVFGAAGAGKTVFAHTLAGQHAFQGRMHFPGLPGGGPDKAVWVLDHQHRFRNLQNQTSFYYQQRYNAFDSEATITVAGDLAILEEPGYAHLSRTELLERFHLAPLLHEPLIQLSNGENKRLQILKAVLRHPRLLILDEPFTGLDADGRVLLDSILKLITESGQQLMLLSSRDHVPACINRFARMENGTLSVRKYPEAICIKQAAAGHTAFKEFPSGLRFEYPDFRWVVRMRDVHIRYGEKSILDGINWEMERGSCWSLTGHNGAGKSTLLSLITGDNPQAYANEIYLFDRRRGSGESIWEIKQKIGYLSPELELYFDPAATAFTTIASGLFDTIGLFRKLTPQQEEGVWEWLKFLDSANDAHRLLSSLPAGIRRMILLGRAMIRKPPVLVLDEPCQGLDSAQTAKTLEMIHRYCREFGASLIFVSHYSAEFPSCISHHLRLEKGKMV